MVSPWAAGALPCRHGSKMQRTKLRLIPVEPISQQPAPWLCENAQVRVYPASPNGAALRAWRLQAALSLRCAARRAGLKKLELTLLERGAATLSESQWAELGERLRVAEGE